MIKNPFGKKDNDQGDKQPSGIFIKPLDLLFKKISQATDNNDWILSQDELVALSGCTEILVDKYFGSVVVSKYAEEFQFLYIAGSIFLPRIIKHYGQSNTNSIGKKGIGKNNLDKKESDPIQEDNNN